MPYNQFGEIPRDNSDNNKQKFADLIIDADGSVKSIPILSGNTEVKEEPTVSSQNDIDLNNYDTNKIEVPTQSTVVEDGNRYYLDPENPLAYNHETKDFEPVSDSKQAPEIATLWEAKEKVNAIDQEKDQESQVTVENEERKIKQNYWDNPQKIKENFNSFEEAMNDVDAKRYSQFQETGINQGESNSITDSSKIFKNYLKSKEDIKVEDKKSETINKEDKDLLIPIDITEQQQTPDEDNQQIPNVGGGEAQQGQPGAEQEAITPEDERRREMLITIEKLTGEMIKLKELYPDNPQIQQLINNIIINIGDLVVNNQQGSLGTPPQSTTTPGQTVTTTPSDQPIPPIPGEDIENSELTGQNTPEQRSAALGIELARLDEIQETRELTDAEKVQYFNLTRQKAEIDRGISTTEQESKAIRDKKEKKIKIIAGLVGVGIALTTPAIGIAAVIAVTLGGSLIGKGLKKWEANLRSKSNSMKYESRLGKTMAELNELDKKQERKAWWANRLGEASALITGGTIGYGLGKAVQNILGWGRAATTITTETPLTTPQAAGEASLGGGNVSTQQVPQGSIELPPQGSIELPPQGGTGEGWLNNTEWLDTSKLGWDSTQLGWKGPNLALGPQGGSYGNLQKEFFGELSKLVSRDQLMGQANAFKVNEFLRAAYNGINPIEAAKSAAQALLGK